MKVGYYSRDAAEQKLMKFKRRGHIILPEATSGGAAYLCLRTQMKRRPADKGGGPHILKL